MLDHNLFDNFGDFHYSLDNTRNRYYLFYYFLNFNYSWHLHYLLNYSINILGLNFNYLFLDNDRDRSVDVHWLYCLLSSVDNLDLFDFNFLIFLGDKRIVNFDYDWNFFFDIERNHLLNHDFFLSKHFMNDGLVHKDFNFPQGFFFVSLDEVGSINIDFFRYFFNNLFFHFKFHIDWFFDCISCHYWFLSHLAQLNKLHLWYFNLHWNLNSHFHFFLVLDYVGYLFLYFN